MALSRSARLLRHARHDTAALTQNSAHATAADHALVHYPSNSVYSDIPKNGCSTRRVSLCLANGCIADVSEWRWIHLNNLTLRADLRDLVCAEYSFVVLFCPQARLASALLDKIVGKTRRYWSLDRALGDRLNHDTLTFRDVVTVLANPKVRSSGSHWRAQSGFPVYEDYDDWFTLERFDEMEATLQRRIGLALADARGLTGHATDELVLEWDRCFAGTPVAELVQLRRAGRAPAHSALYDATLAGDVAQHYAADLALYHDRFGAADLLFAK